MSKMVTQKTNFTFIKMEFCASNSGRTFQTRRAPLDKKRWHNPGCLERSWTTTRNAPLEKSAGIIQAVILTFIKPQRDTRRGFSDGISQAFLQFLRNNYDATRAVGLAAGYAWLEKRSWKTLTRRRQLVFDWEIRLLQGSSYRIQISSFILLSKSQTFL